MGDRITLAQAVGASVRAPTREQVRRAKREAELEREARAEADLLDRLESGIFRQINDCADPELGNMALQLGLS